MRIPERLPIMRMEDYHTHYLGQCEDGRLFWAYETFVFRKLNTDISGDDWQKYRNEYVLLHTFDRDGNYLHTTHLFVGTTAELKGISLEMHLDQLVEKLGKVEYKDIKIKLFEVVIDDITFGLIPDKESGMINLQPSSTISFQEPWDGEYYT